MKRIRGLFVIILILCVCFSLCTCGNTAPNGGASTEATPTEIREEASTIEGTKLTDENVKGTGWQCTYHNAEGDKIYCRFTLSAEGDYRAIIAINGLFSHAETGTYEVKNGKLYLYLNGDEASATVYEYKKGNLINDGNEFTPYSE